MKYKLKKTEVDVKRHVMRADPKTKGMNCDFEVTDADGKKTYIMQKELLEKYEQVHMTAQPQPVDTIKLALEGIIDLGILVDDDNAEELLHEAIQRAFDIKKML